MLTCLRGTERGGTGGTNDSRHANPGQRHLETVGVQLWDDDDRWVAVPELRFGQSDGPTELVFGEISGLAVGAEGEIIVLDRQAQELRVFVRSVEMAEEAAWAGAVPRQRMIAVRDGGRATVTGTLPMRLTLAPADTIQHAAEMMGKLQEYRLLLLRQQISEAIDLDQGGQADEHRTVEWLGDRRRRNRLPGRQHQGRRLEGIKKAVAR